MNLEINWSRKIILDLYEMRKKSNNRYSLRALARDLGIEQSNLSKIINGKRRLNPNHIQAITRVFNLTEDHLNLIKSMMELK